jgi:hypothetical protein
VFDVFFLKWLELVPEIKDAGYHQADANANQKKPAISRQPDQKNQNHRHGDNQACRASEITLGFGGLRVQFLAAPGSGLFYRREILVNKKARIRGPSRRNEN